MIHAMIIIITLALVTLGGCQLHQGTDQHPPFESFTFIQLCDTQLGMGGYDHDVNTFKQAVKQINALKPDFTVICGDLVNKPNPESFADFIEIKNGLTVKCYCAPGNHDIDWNPTKASLKQYREIIGPDYYAIEHKGYTFMITNTQLWKSPLEGESKKHHDWVVNTLEKSKAKGSPVFVICHYPLYLSDPDEEEHGYNLPIPVRKELLALYKANNVIAVLTGHTHRKTINDYNGIQMVTGETTSVNFDKRPMGFRLWQVSSPDIVHHTFVPLEESKDALKK